MNPEDHVHPQWHVITTRESSCETWGRLCTTWSTILKAATVRENSGDVAHAELTLAMCERERARVEALFYGAPGTG